MDLTCYDIQSVANVSFLDNNFGLVISLGIHTVNYLTHLGRLQVFEKVILVDGILYKLLRSVKQTTQNSEFVDGFLLLRTFFMWCGIIVKYTDRHSQTIQRVFQGACPMLFARWGCQFVHYLTFLRYCSKFRVAH